MSSTTGAWLKIHVVFNLGLSSLYCFSNYMIYICQSLSFAFGKISYPRCRGKMIYFLEHSFVQNDLLSLSPLSDVGAK